MNKTQLRKQFNKYRFELLTGHGTLYVVDNKTKTLTVYREERKESLRENYVEDVLLTNGWTHLRNIEESLE